MERLQFPRPPRLGPRSRPETTPGYFVSTFFICCPQQISEQVIVGGHGQGFSYTS